MGKRIFFILALFPAAGGGLSGAAAADNRPYPSEQRMTSEDPVEKFDIDRVVETTLTAMAAAARNYYLPDKPENARPISRHTKDSLKIAFADTAFKQELARICVDLAAAARAAGKDEQMLPGRPLELPRSYPEVPIGVSSITVSEEKGMTVVFTNTMPCVSTGAKALHAAMLKEFPRTAAEDSAKKRYTREFGVILTNNRLFNHLHAEVCSKMVRAARMAAQENSATKKK